MIGIRTIVTLLTAPALMSVAPVHHQGAGPIPYAARPMAGMAHGASMRAMISAAAAVVQVEPPATIKLYGGLGRINFRITTSSSLAQRFFNQGMGFAYGFNHAAAIASFREAQRLDPTCAMCWWGEALAQGPNINAPLTPDANADAIRAIDRAQSLTGPVTPPERALIMALAKRYTDAPAADRAALDGAYADAMLTVARYYPENDDIALVAAEAAMDTLPWDYWMADRRTAKPRIAEAVRLVEAVMARSPEHPQGAHLYIHLMENGPDPRRAEAAADRLAKPLSPDAGHLVHMPAHIYYVLGRWKDSIRLNVDAARADEAYIRESNDRGLVRYGYYPHNVHFIVTSAQMAGDLPTAIREANRLGEILDPEIASKIGWIQAIYAAPYFAESQFAAPRDVLAMAEPDPRLPYAAAMRHYARAVAYAQLRDPKGFDAELKDLDRIRSSPELKTTIDQGVPAADLIDLAQLVARGRFASARGHYLQAAVFYRQAIVLEDRIAYTEPPFWYYPVHQSLGSALYRAGRFREAKQAFSAALAKAPNNGWALYGLAASERALGHRSQAASAQIALKRAWLGDPEWLRMDRL